MASTLQDATELRSLLEWINPSDDAKNKNLVLAYLLLSVNKDRSSEDNENSLVYYIAQDYIKTSDKVSDKVKQLFEELELSYF